MDGNKDRIDELQRQLHEARRELVHDADDVREQSDEQTARMLARQAELITSLEDALRQLHAAVEDGHDQS